MSLRAGWTHGPRRKLIRLIQQLGEAGKTIITATHNLEIVEEIADRALVFSEDHHLVAAGSCEEILEDIGLLARVNLIDEEFHLHHHGHGQALIHAHDAERIRTLSLESLG